MLKNALYLNENYKKDCEKKINYKNINNNTSSSKNSNIYFTKQIKENSFKLLGK